MSGMDVYVLFNQLEEFELMATEDDFIKLFGERMGHHLWQKFTRQCSFSFVRLWPNLSHDNRIKLCESYADSHKEVPF